MSIIAIIVCYNYYVNNNYVNLRLRWYYFLIYKKTKTCNFLINLYFRRLWDRSTEVTTLTSVGLGSADESYSFLAFLLSAT
jgi:hypothetical protein